MLQLTGLSGGALRAQLYEALQLNIGVRLQQSMPDRMLFSGSRIGAVGALLGGLACEASRDRAKVPQASEAGVAATADPRRCTVSGLAALPPDTAAVRCAEWFVARNGYTDLPPAGDSTQRASESIEFGSSLGEVLASRRNTLSRGATVVCRYAPGGAGYTVGFAAPGDRERRYGRAVTMNNAFAELRVEHQTYLLSEAVSDSARCDTRG